MILDWWEMQKVYWWSKWKSLTPCWGSNDQLGVKHPQGSKSNSKILIIFGKFELSKMKTGHVSYLWILTPPIWLWHRGQISKWGSNTLGLKTKLKPMYLLRIWAEYNENWPFEISMGFDPPIWPRHRGQMSKWGSNTPGLKTKLKNMYLLRIWAQYNENWPF